MFFVPLPAVFKNLILRYSLLTIHVQYNFLGQRRHHMAIGRLAGVHLQDEVEVEGREKRLVYDLYAHYDNWAFD